MDPTTGRRELVILAVSVAALGRFVDPPFAWVVVVLLGAAVAVGVVRSLGRHQGHFRGDSLVPAILPALAAAGGLGLLAVVPVGILLVPALFALGCLLELAIRLELRSVAASAAGASEDRTTVLAVALVIAFVAFAGAAALISGGLVEPGGSDAPGSSALPGGTLIGLALVDALVSGLLGYRLTVRRERGRRAALWSAGTYATVVAIGAAAIRAVALPRLLGPALLTLVFFLWDAIHGAPPERRRDPRWIWQTALLAILGIVVIAWNVALRN